VRHQAPLRYQGDAGRARLHVRNDMRGEDHNARARQLRKQVAEAHALFGIEAGRRLVDDQELGIVQQRLCDTNSLLHASRIAAQRTFARLQQIDHREQLIDSPARRSAVEALGGRQIFQELHGIQIGINPEILWQVAQYGAQAVRRTRCVDPVPSDRSLGSSGDGCQNAHQCGLTGPVWPEQSQNARTDLQAEILQCPDVALVDFADLFNDELHSRFERE
jgi:hypothetical protein